MQHPKRQCLRRPQISISRQLREDSAAISITKVHFSPDDTLQAVMQGIEALTDWEIRVVLSATAHRLPPMP
jgi:hypothetical protein